MALIALSSLILALFHLLFLFTWPGQSFMINMDKLANSSVSNKRMIVAQDGSADYRTIQAAIDAAPSESNKKFTIYIKRGVYREYVKITNTKKNLVMIGESIRSTIITGSRTGPGIKTYYTATVVIEGSGFIARDITFQNTAGPHHQAVALRAEADKLIFYRCAFKGYQDTLYAKYGLQFFRECQIYGTVDFIFGDAKAVFQKCDIIVRKPLPNQFNVVTAQSQARESSATGFSFHRCSFKADGDLAKSKTPTSTYLGRPWGDYSRVVVMKSSLGSLIDPLGWTPWNEGETSRLKTLYYGEYMNNGAGSSTKGRVKWPGFHPRMSFKKANKFTVRNFIFGDEWLPSTRVPYDPDL